MCRGELKIARKLAMRAVAACVVMDALCVCAKLFFLRRCRGVGVCASWWHYLSVQYHHRRLCVAMELKLACVWRLTTSPNGQFGTRVSWVETVEGCCWPMPMRAVVAAVLFAWCRWCEGAASMMLLRPPRGDGSCLAVWQYKSKTLHAQAIQSTPVVVDVQ